MSHLLSVALLVVFVSSTLAVDSVIVVSTRTYSKDDAYFQDFVIQEYSFGGDLLTEGTITEARYDAGYNGFAVISCPAIDPTNRALYYVNSGVVPSIAKDSQYYLYHYYLADYSQDAPQPVNVSSIYCQAVTSPGPGRFR
jgi:hypothetical protein